METGKKKKLLVTASTFPRWEGDTEPRFVLDLSRYLAEYFDVTVLAPAAPGAEKREEMEGVHVVRYHYFPIHGWETLCYPGAIVPRIKEKKIRLLLVPFLLLSLYIKLAGILSDYDLVHAHWLIPQGVIQSLFRKPYIVTGHGGDVASLNKGLLKRCKARCIRKACRVTVVSEQLKSKLQELAPDADPDVISMGVDTEKFGRQHYVPDYFGQNGKKVVLFVGRLAEKKGVTYLIEAMKEVDAVLAVAGDGPLRKELEEQAVPIRDKVMFLGAKTHDELKILYASADIFAAPSVTAEDGDQEGMPTTIMEAMASGIPIVSTKSSGIMQLIDDGENGLLCEEKNISRLAENINRLLENEQLCRQLVKNGLETVREYDYSVIAERYKEILYGIL